MSKNRTNILVTGAAGFIGFHLSLRLLKDGFNVVGLDNLNDYYEVGLKEARLKILKEYQNFTFVHTDLENQDCIKKMYADYDFNSVIHLAAQAGVRYSMINPHGYISSNIVGFMKILEACRQHQIKHLIYASSSSVYGANTKMPFSVYDNVDHPVSLYAATKKSNELMAHAYSHLYGVPTTGLRFFTVYGPWGRPDMAYFSFTKAILKGTPIKIFNYGKMKRDFTYIDDIVEGIIKLIDKAPIPNSDLKDILTPGTSYAPYQIYNIGNNCPVDLMYFISILEKELGIKANKELLPMQPGDVWETYADIDNLTKLIGFKPKTTIEEGIHRFVKWFKSYYI